MRRILRVLMIASVLVFVGAAVTAGWAWHRGYRVYAVRTASMEPTLHVGDAIVIGPMKGRPVAGDVVTFRPAGSPTLVTHRVTSVVGSQLTTKGDANDTEDTWLLDASAVKGEVVERLPSFGYVLIYLRQPTGLASLFMFGLAIVMLWQMFFSTAPTAAGGASECPDQLGRWDELVATLEAVAASMTPVRTATGTPPLSYVDLLASPGAVDVPALQVSWSEDTLLVLEVLCDRIAARNNVTATNASLV